MSEAMADGSRGIATRLLRALKRPIIQTPASFAVSDIRCEKLTVIMRDGLKLATDVYLPPEVPGPAVALRTPYGRGWDSFVGIFFSLARRGYVVVAQDCRGTGDSEPDNWDYYVYEPEDSYDLVEWISGQTWFNGFLGAFGGSYCGQMQWQMARHPRMSTIVPSVSGLGIAVNTVHLHMFNNAYARSVGKGEGKSAVPLFELERQMLTETLATGYFNEPLNQLIPERVKRGFPELQCMTASEARNRLWEHYCSSGCAERAEFVKSVLEVRNITSVDVESLSTIFGQTISHDRHTLPHTQPERLCKEFHAPVLLTTGWYDWGLNDALATWELLMRCADEPMRSSCRLFIGPNAHNVPGYHEGMAELPELQHAHSANVELLLQWYETVRKSEIDSWPVAIYYLMGASEWRAASAWPPREARITQLYLDTNGCLSPQIPQLNSPDEYIYDPSDPTPTAGGSIVSYVYPPGSVDVSAVQKRSDVLTYTGEALKYDLDVVGPLRMVLYVSSTAPDTDFAVRLTDVFPDGRAIQLQNGVLRCRYRNGSADPDLLVPGEIYKLEIDMWATANRFKAGHRVRIDISSADFPRFDRNSNRGGYGGDPIAARQTIYHDVERPSHLLLPVMPRNHDGNAPKS